MPTTDQARTSTSPARSEDAGRLEPPAWPTRDLERRSNRAESLPKPTPAQATTTRHNDTPATHPIEPTTANPADVPTSTSMEGDMAPTGTSPMTTASAAAKTPAPATPMTPAMTVRKAFLADLTRAMRIAAEEQRAEVLGRLRADAEACVTSMQGMSADAASVARERCDADIATLEEWCAEELRRIRRETDDSIAERRTGLEAELTTQAERLTSGVARVETTVAGFESQMTMFFERLLVEEDPTSFAGMAERMPEAPTFDDWSPTAADAADATAAEAVTDELTVAAVITTTDGMDMDALEADALAAAEAEAAADSGSDTDHDPESTWSAATPAAPMAPTDGSTTTRAVVCALGLVSVASVSSFKRVLARAEGIHTVSVSSGPQGEFVFNLTCDPEVDLGAIVAGLPGFDIDMRSVTEGRVDVVARERDQSS